jgi:hypothetical protein
MQITTDTFKLPVLICTTPSLLKTKIESKYSNHCTSPIFIAGSPGSILGRRIRIKEQDLNLEWLLLRLQIYPQRVLFK